MSEEESPLVIGTRADPASPADINHPSTIAPSETAGASEITHVIKPSSVHWVGPIQLGHKSYTDINRDSFALYHVPEASEVDRERYSRTRSDIYGTLLSAYGLTEAMMHKTSPNGPPEQGSATEAEQFEKALNEIERRATEGRSTVVVFDRTFSLVSIEDFGSQPELMFEEIKRKHKQDNEDPYFKDKEPVYLSVYSLGRRDRSDSDSDSA